MPRGSCSAASAVVLMFAQHRSGFLALAVALGATAFFLVGSERALRGLGRLAFGGIAVGLIAVTFFGGSYIDDTIVRIEHTFDTSDPTAAWRLLSWYEVGSGIIDRPLGHGFATWDFVFNATDPLRGSHNSFLDLTYRVGVPGLGAFLALPISLVSRTRQLVARGIARLHSCRRSRVLVSSRSSRSLSSTSALIPHICRSSSGSCSVSELAPSRTHARGSSSLETDRKGRLAQRRVRHQRGRESAVEHQRRALARREHACRFFARCCYDTRVLCSDGLRSRVPPDSSRRTRSFDDVITHEPVAIVSRCTHPRWSRGRARRGRDQPSRSDVGVRVCCSRPGRDHAAGNRRGRGSVIRAAN